MPNNSKKIIFHAFADHLKNDRRVSGVFVAGSEKNGGTTIFSDLDLWAVFSDESGLNSFSAEIREVAGSIGTIRGIYQCTAQHYFIVYKPSIQIDLNLLTSAQFFSIKSAKKRFVFDRRHFLDDSQKNKTAKARRNACSDFLFQGYTTLERCASKYLKNDYFVAVKFLEVIRENCLVPLFKIAGIQRLATPISLNLESMDNSLRNIFMATYAKPARSSCAEGIEATFLLLLKISNKLKIAGFEDYESKFKKFIANN